MKDGVLGIYQSCVLIKAEFIIIFISCFVDCFPVQLHEDEPETCSIIENVFVEDTLLNQLIHVVLDHGHEAHHSIIDVYETGNILIERIRQVKL